MNIEPMTFDQAVQLAVEKVRESVDRGPAKASASSTELIMIAFATRDHHAWLPTSTVSQDDLWKRLNVSQRAAVTRYHDEDARIQAAMAAWNEMTDAQRAAALKAANTAMPATAMRHLGYDIPETIMRGKLA